MSTNPNPTLRSLTRIASFSKRPKLKRKPDRNGIDRLSNLPENILLHILSFVPTETAASTTVLSKSWQFLWTSVRDLDFDASRHTHGFSNFVTGALLHRREWFIRRFRLKCHKNYDPSELNLWVSCAMDQNVQELDIDLDDMYNDSFRFRCTQNSWKHLVVLKLRSVVLDEVCFPALKIFHLEAAEDTNFEVEYQEIKFLPSRFPVLQELVIVRKSGFHEANCEIYLPKLRSLAIDKSTIEGFVRIDCPALTHLVIENKNSREYHLQNLLSLVEAHINVQPDLVWNNKDISYGRYVMDVVKAISNVRIMRIFYHTMKEIELAFFRGDDIPIFHNLVKVELPFVGLKNIILMLQKFQHLECLILWYEGAQHCGWEIGRLKDDTKEMIKQIHVPSCLTSRLTTFCSRQFKGINDEMEFKRYILENSLVLENMTIFLSSSLTSFDKGQIRREIRESRAFEGYRFDLSEEEGEGA